MVKKVSMNNKFLYFLLYILDNYLIENKVTLKCLLISYFMI